jgi:hypothetical protein
MRLTIPDSGQIMRVAVVGGMVLSVLACTGPATTSLSSAPADASRPPAVAAPPGATPGEVQALRERTAAFWAARIAADPVKQWELLEPRGQGRMTASDYAAVPRAVKYLAYQVEDANIRGYFASVRVRLIVQPVLPSAPQRQIPPGAIIVNDSWVRVRGTWYRALEQEETAGQTEAQAAPPTGAQR